MRVRVLLVSYSARPFPTIIVPCEWPSWRDWRDWRLSSSKAVRRSSWPRRPCIVWLPATFQRYHFLCAGGVGSQLPTTNRGDPGGPRDGCVCVYYCRTPSYCKRNNFWQSSNLAVQNGFISRGSSGLPQLFRVAVQGFARIF